jgi:hypothetical protein
MRQKLPSVFIFAFPILLFISCQSVVQKNRLTPDEQAELISKGKKITMQSFKALSGEVMNALQEGGVEHAVGYCHLQASPFIDSLADAYGVKISRVSDQYRNPSNKPGNLDLTVLDSYRQQLAEGVELQPHLEITADEIIYYSPILLLNPACLQCHGEPGSTLEQTHYDFIKSKYPNDLAIGYKLGDLRGIWKIVF